MLLITQLFMMFCRLLIFPSKFKKIPHDYHQSGKQVGSRSGPMFCRPDLRPNCLQRLSADDTSKQRVPENLTILLVYQVQTTEYHESYKST